MELFTSPTLDRTVWSRSILSFTVVVTASIFEPIWSVDSLARVMLSLPSAAAALILFIKPRMPSRFFLVSSARSLTSVATTAKPFPCSPALAASMEAFSARRLVWLAIPATLSIILPISPISSISCSILSLILPVSCSRLSLSPCTSCSSW